MNRRELLKTLTAVPAALGLSRFAVLRIDVPADAPPESIVLKPDPRRLWRPWDDPNLFNKRGTFCLRDERGTDYEFSGIVTGWRLEAEPRSAVETLDPLDDGTTRTRRLLPERIEVSGRIDFVATNGLVATLQ